MKNGFATIDHEGVKIPQRNATGECSWPALIPAEKSGSFPECRAMTSS